MSKNLERYRGLELRLLKVRAANRGKDTPEEDHILGEMDEVWGNMGGKERSAFLAAALKAAAEIKKFAAHPEKPVEGVEVIMEDDTVGSSCLRDSNGSILIRFKNFEESEAWCSDRTNDDNDPIHGIGKVRIEVGIGDTGSCILYDVSPASEGVRARELLRRAERDLRKIGMNCTMKSPEENPIYPVVLDQGIVEKILKEREDDTVGKEKLAARATDVNLSDELSFSKELEALINRHSMENNSDTPDFILASFMRKCLRAFDSGTRERDKWMGKERWKPGQVCKEGEA